MQEAQCETKDSPPAVTRIERGRLAIAFWSTGYFRGIGGSERMVNAMLQELDRAGVETALLADAPPGDDVSNPYLPALPRGCHVHTDTFPDPLLSKGRPVAFVRAALQYASASLRLLRFFARVRPQLVHQQLVNLDVFLLVLCKQLFGYRLIVTFRGSDITTAERSRLTRLKIRCALRFADAATGVSREIASSLRERFGATSASWIPNGVDLATTRRAKDAGEPIIEPDHFVYCGRLHAVKRLPFLVQVFRRCVAAGCDRNLYIIGNGEEAESLTRLIARHGLTGRVVLVGGLRHELALRAIAHARCLLLFSRSEGCPNVLLEASALAVPVIATDVGGVRDVVVQGKTGYVFAPEDGQAAEQYMLRLARSPDLARALGRSAATYVEAQYNLESVMACYVALYESLLDRSPVSQCSLRASA